MSGKNNAADDTTAFLAEASSIQDAIDDYSANVSRIAELHAESSKALVSDAESQGITRRLDALVQDTSAKSRDIKRRVDELGRQGASNSRDSQIRTQRIGFIRQKFQDAVRNYQEQEYQQRQKARQKLERQIEIVKPDATPEEIKAIVDGGQGNQVFADALLGSNRRGESTAAYKEVQARHADVQKIEQTLVELAQLFNDLGTMTEKQGETIDVIQEEATKTERELELGGADVEQAKIHAAAARRKRKICFLISVIILIIIAIIVAVAVTQTVNKK